MTKASLARKIGQAAGVTKAQALAFIDGFAATVQQGLVREGEVQLVGFGKFYAQRRAARKGRNPLTGAMISIPPSVYPAFRPGLPLKLAVAGRQPKPKW